MHGEVKYHGGGHVVQHRGSPYGGQEAENIGKGLGTTIPFKGTPYDLLPPSVNHLPIMPSNYDSIHGSSKD
jgi:hypothetical protein